MSAKLELERLQSQTAANLKSIEAQQQKNRALLGLIPEVEARPEYERFFDEVVTNIMIGGLWVAAIVIGCQTLL